MTVLSQIPIFFMGYFPLACEDKTKKVLTSVRPFVQSRANDLKSKKICTYCSSGYTDELSNQGFDAKTIEGGYSAWKDREKRKRCDYCFI
jgi:hypothetical protein